MANDETIWGETQEQFAEYVSVIEDFPETRSMVEKRVATALFELPEDLPEEYWGEVLQTMAPVGSEELAHLDYYVRMSNEYNTRLDEVVQSDILPIMETYETELDTKLAAYAEKTNGAEAYTAGIERAVKREGKKIAVELELDIDKEALDSALEEVSNNLAMMSSMVGGGILSILRSAASDQRFDQELEKWKAENPNDILTTYDAELKAGKELISGIADKYFQD